MKFLDWLHQAAGRKIITYIGLAISSVASTCLLVGDEWLGSHIGAWSPRICGTFIFVGGVIAAFGKGLGDRRIDPEKQAIEPENKMEERRQPAEGKEPSNG